MAHQTEQPAQGSILGVNKHEEAVVSSALWAAAGDAVGWIGELADERGVKYRTGARSIAGPTEWVRKIGGRFGPKVTLPAGTYSDDTQLRLAVSRSIRGTGEFDVEAFAKVELTVWPSYALGAGRGTMGAATNLAKSSVAWFSNFFDAKGRGYFDGGGNGAAMRIHPHIWKCKPNSSLKFLSDVMRDAIVTHGHPQGFCGAVFHALTLSHVFAESELPAPNEWADLMYKMAAIPDAVRNDDKLSVFWLGAWEEGAKSGLDAAVAKQIEQGVSVLEQIGELLKGGRRDSSYRNIISTLGGFDESRRGAGMNSAIAALALAWLYRDEPNETALLVSANTLGSDTDTIGSMAGALLGASSPQSFNWELQDKDYIVSEARRMANLADGNMVGNFNYPDLMHWQPPGSQSDVVCHLDNGLAMAGFGAAEPFGPVWSAGDAEWQWLRLSFGQTVLAKRRLEMRSVTKSELPLQFRIAATPERDVTSNRKNTGAQPRLPLGDDNVFVGDGVNSSNLGKVEGTVSDDLDTLTDWVIRSDFSPEIIGRAFLRCSASPHGLERAVAFSSIIAKAVIVRKKKRRE